jgi:hypothetical protein
MNFKVILFLAIAAGLYFVGQSVGLQGDAAPVGANGVSPERAKYHLIALVLTLGAFGCVIYAGVALFRGRR